MTEIEERILKFCVPEDKSSPDDVTELETVIGKKLPEPYVNQMVNYGPLYIDNELEYTMQFRLHWTKIEGSIPNIEDLDELPPEDIMTHQKGIQSSLKQSYEFEELKGVMPPYDRFVVIFETDDGNYIMFDLSPDHYGRVVAWHAQMTTWGEGKGAYLAHIADDYVSFLNDKLEPVLWDDL